ncbi:porphobilinogen synthase [Thiotrichales bacterium 19S3-7]|nr:porphobilinogen synthase [Thiotrichales bacterium 19S3-7]MCF6800868.1 porphobilinogen synthase [Thiotrichales bacterium 19S3-11]
MVFPLERPRRLRGSHTLRKMVSETYLSVNDLIYPIFIVHGKNIKKEIEPMPGQFHWSVDRLDEIISEVVKAKISSVILFGIPKVKDTNASENYNENGIVQQAIREIKKQAPNLVVITDVCLCAYTEEGHCGIYDHYDDIVLNDQTLPILAKTAVSHARAGADIVAPSGMIDGMILAMREGLDEAGFVNTAILSYAVKYASAFYGPFRAACDSSPKGDRKTYQMDYRNAKEALREASLDEIEGADFLMVKPALAYMDIIYRVSQKTNLPMVAYHISGEYALVKAAAEKGWVNEKDIMLETLYGLKRAGASLIITYAAIDVANWLIE